MLDPLYEVIARVVLVWHAVFRPLFGPDDGATWALSIVFLVVTVRLLLFPLFVKQIRSQRAMQVLQPKIKELQAKHKGDRETLNREMMALYKEHGANPVAGCLPLLLQLPVFLSLFHVLRRIKPGATPLYGFTQDRIDSAARAKVFGAPISAAFNSPLSKLEELKASQGAVRTVTILLVALMCLTTYVTQRQMIARTGPASDPQTALMQKFLLYVMPASLAVSGLFFPLGVLLYWFTTNLWTMGQQFYVLKRMPPPGAAGASAATTTGTGVAAAAPKPGARPQRPPRPAATAGSEKVADTGGETTRPGPQAPGVPSRPPASSRRKKGARKGGRR